jgi:16S rRNA (guanine527-N7)-methyltransferase
VSDTTLPGLQARAAELGVPLDDDALARFSRYRELLLAANEQFNLTRITDPGDVESRLFGDSIALIPHIPEDARRLLDIGTGAGIPGLPLAIARPDLRVMLMDSTGKKVRFLAETAAELGLENVATAHGRAEEMARDKAHRERYDVVTARAVARLVVLVELGLPFVTPGGIALFPKGQAASEELLEARYAIGMLGGREVRVIQQSEEGSALVVIQKSQPTSAAFPRRVGVPNKTPLYGPEQSR